MVIDWIATGCLMFTGFGGAVVASSGRTTDHGRIGGVFFVVTAIVSVWAIWG